MASEWAYAIAREQRRDVETMATNLEAARAQGRREGLEEEKLQERKRQEMILWREVFVSAFKEDVAIGDCASSAGRAAQLFRIFYEKAENA